MQDNVNKITKMREGKVKETQQQKEELIEKSKQLASQVLQLLTRLETDGFQCANLLWRDHLAGLRITF